MYNYAGQLVYNENMNTGSNATKEINFNLHASGVYTLNVLTETDIAIKQIIVNR
ncbi:MAG: T9SS type A sorting domain-containing protein [Chitinophagales bacterium]